MEYFLAVDIFSIFKKVVYGYAGEQVKLISDEGGVCLVENMEGNRYPVLKTELRTENDMPLPAAAEPIPPSENKPNPKPITKKPEQQTSLF